MYPDSQKIRESFSTRLGDLLEEWKSKGVSRKEIADGAGISTSALSNYLNNEQSPALDVLLNLANYFDVSIDYLFEQTDVRTPNIDNVAISDKTHLTPEAIDELPKLIDSYSVYNQWYWTDKKLFGIDRSLLNQLLEMPAFEKLLAASVKYIQNKIYADVVANPPKTAAEYTSYEMDVAIESYFSGDRTKSNDRPKYESAVWGKAPDARLDAHSAIQKADYELQCMLDTIVDAEMPEITKHVADYYKRGSQN